MCGDEKIIDTNYRAIFKKPAIRFIAIVLFVCVILVSVLSGLFIITRANHVHDHGGSHESCTTCNHLANAENLIKQLSTAIVVAVLAFVLSSIISFYLKLYVLSIFSTTLVALKIRLNN